jgi:hopanoid biosynthesis associated protein HpnK
LRRLVITADDFGAAMQVNEAVEEAHGAGVLTAASLMVSGAAVGDAVDRARRLPSLRVGLHLVLVDGAPILPAAQVPQLVDARGRFHDDMVAAGARMFFHPSARRQLRAEIAAQFAAFAATGLSLDHVNAHKHFHLHPTIAGLILEIGARFGMHGARIPIEPGAVLARIEPGRRPAAEPLVAFWASRARRRFRRAGVLAPDQVFGLRWSGAMTTERLTGLLESLPPGLSEIYLHPATSGDFEGAAEGYRYAEELAALTHPGVRQAARTHRRGGFSDFAEDRLPVAA